MIDEVEEGLVAGQGVAHGEGLFGSESRGLPDPGGDLVHRGEEAVDLGLVEEVVEDEVPLLIEVPFLRWGHGDGHGSSPGAASKTGSARNLPTPLPPVNRVRAPATSSTGR